MLSKSQQTKQPIDEHDEVNLKGTLFFVTLIGIFIVLTWLGVWYIFISR